MSDNTAWGQFKRRVSSAEARCEEQQDAEGRRAGANIMEFWRLRDFIDRLIDAETIRGRMQGAAWQTLGLSKQQAQQRHAAAMRRREMTRDFVETQ